MKVGGSMLTLTYESTKAIPNYNVMGVCKSALEASVKYLARDLGGKGMRVNAISAGPIKTLAASAIGDAKFLYKWNEDHSFLKRNVDILFKVYKKEIEVAGKKTSLETGKVARQADGAIIASCGETVILATVVGAKKINPLI